MDARLPIVAALEALEVGDVDYAVAILLGALEDGPVSCACGFRAEWPGLLDCHIARGLCSLGRAA